MIGFPKLKTPSFKRLREQRARRFRNAAWKALGFKNGFGRYSGHCARCGRLVEQGGDGEIDHIKPKSTHPELRYDVANARITCGPCNRWFKGHPMERE